MTAAAKALPGVAPALRQDRFHGKARDKSGRGHHRHHAAHGEGGLDQFDGAPVPAALAKTLTWLSARKKTCTSA